jgi:hypothetical protein
MKDSKMYEVRCKSCGYTFFLKGKEEKKNWDRGYLEPSCPNKACKNFNNLDDRDSRKGSIWEVKEVN